MITLKTVCNSNFASRNNKAMECHYDQTKKKKAFALEVKTCINYPRSIDLRRETSKCKLMRNKNTWRKSLLIFQT